jgi:O-antigen/teichoic acid export membrane protein
MESTVVALNVRSLNLRPIFLLDLVGRTVPLPIMIVWAWVAPSVWALVAGALVGGAVRLLVSHVALPGPRMAFIWHRADIKEIVAFGKWVNVSSTATFLGGQSDRLLLGFLVPSSAFSFYAIARLMFDISQSLLDRLNSTLTLPVLGEVTRDRGQQLRAKYYRFRFPFEVFAPLAGGILFSSGAVIVDILFDQRYADAGQMLQILSIGLISYPALFVAGLFTVVGEPRIAAIASILQAVSLIGSLLVGHIIAGTLGAVWGIALHKALPSAVILLIAHRRRWIDFVKELRVLPLFVLGIIVGEGIVATARALGITGVGHFWG